MSLGLNPLIAGLLISEIAGLVLLIVLYRLVQEDFDQERAFHTVLYLSIFPSAFFLAAGYNEALFICLTVLSFYCMRHGQWWLAGLFGLFANLILLSFIGPWKFPGKLRLYSIYAAILYLFLQLFPTGGVFPLESTSRFMLEVFPAFIVLASIGARFRTVHLSYLMISGALVFF